MYFHYQKDKIRGILRHLSSDRKKKEHGLHGSFFSSLHTDDAALIQICFFMEIKLEKGKHALGRQGRLTLDYFKILSEDYTRYK